MSAHNPSIARKMSRSSDEPYLYESFSKAYDNETGENKSYSKTDCLRLAKTLSDMNQIPVSCKEIVKNDQNQRKAWEGASVTDRARQAIAARKGSMSHHQLQRRLTTTSEAMAR